MVNDQPSPQPPRWSRTGIFLALSLALNLLVAGIIAGALLSPDGPRGHQTDRAGRDIGATPFVRAVDPGDRRSILAAARGEAQSLRRNRDELRLRFDALLGAIRADVFDPSEVAALLALQRSAAAERQEIGERILIEYLGDLDVDARGAYADRLESMVRRRPGHRAAD